MEKQIVLENGQLEQGRATLAKTLECLAQDRDELKSLNGAAVEAEQAKHKRESLKRTVQQFAGQERFQLENYIQTTYLTRVLHRVTCAYERRVVGSTTCSCAPRWG